MSNWMEKEYCWFAFASFCEVLPSRQLIAADRLRIILETARGLEENEIQQYQNGLSDFQKLIDYMVGFKDFLLSQAEEKLITNLDKLINEAFFIFIRSRFIIALKSQTMNLDLDFLHYWVKVYSIAEWYNDISAIYQEYTLTHGETDPTPWIHAAQYPLHLKGAHGIDEARRIIGECSDYYENKHPKVFLAVLRIELMHQHCLNVRLTQVKEGEGGDTIDAAAVASKTNRLMFGLHYKSSIVVLTSVTPLLFMEIYKMLNEYAGVWPDLKSQVLRDMETHCSRSEDTYRFLGISALESDGGILKLTSVRKCFDAFDKGIECVPSREMYRSYFGVHAKILTSLQSEMEKLHVLDNLMKMWKRANKLKFFTKEDYMAWLDYFKKVQESQNDEMTKDEVLSLAKLKREKWIRRELAKEGKPGDSKRRKVEEDKRRKIFNIIQEIVNLALENYPKDSEVVEEKINCILDDPANFHLYYGSLRVVQALEFLKKVGELEGNVYLIYQKLFLYCIRHRDCEKETENLLLMAPQEGAIQERLVQEYIGFSSTDGDKGKKMVMKFLKKLEQANQKPLDESITALAKMLIHPSCG